MSRTRPQLHGARAESGDHELGIVSREGDLSERGGYSAFAARRHRGRSNNSVCALRFLYAEYLSARERSREAGSRGLMETGALTRLDDLDL